MGKPKKANKAKGTKTAHAKAAPKRAPAKAQAKAKASAKAASAKAKKPAKAAKAAKAAPAAHGKVPSVAELKARWPVLSDKETEAFESLIGDAQADDLGRRTRSQDVLREAARWAGIIDEALRSYGDGALKDYSPRRFAYYLLATGELTEAIAAETRRAGESKRTGAEATRSLATRARKETIERLSTFAGMRPVERNALDEAAGPDQDHAAALGGGVDLLVRSLRALAYLEVDWLERNDPASQVLAENAGLSHDDALELRSFAEALSTRKLAAALAGPPAAKDTPTLNRLEGRVLFEMREARRVFAHAHSKSHVVPKLEPHGGIGHIFTTKAPKKSVHPPAESNGSSFESLSDN